MLKPAVLLGCADNGAFLPSGVSPARLGSACALSGSSPDPLAALASGKVQEESVSTAQGVIVGNKNNADWDALGLE